MTVCTFDLRKPTGQGLIDVMRRGGRSMRCLAYKEGCVARLGWLLAMGRPSPGLSVYTPRMMKVGCKGVIHDTCCRIADW